MKVKHGTALIPAVLLAGLVLSPWYWKSHGTTEYPLAAEGTSTAVPPLITTAQPAMRAFTQSIPWMGIVEPKASVELTALTAGRVEAITVEDQARVEPGALVTQLGGPQIEGERAKLTAEVESLETRLKLIRQEIERIKQSLQAHLATKDQVAAVLDTQVKLETQLREARLNLKTFEKKARIDAPMGGTFTNRQVSLGQEVKAGQVLGEIIDTSHLRIVASLFPPQDIDLEGKEATIRLDENQTLTGLVRSVLPRASDTGATMVWIEGSEIDRKLRPGQTVEGDMVVAVGSETLAVPESAIVYDEEERPYLFVRKNGTYEARRVRLGLVQDGWVEVLSGLEQSQSVVTQGAYELFYRRFNEQFKVPD
jgi:RND family efflux transporter MFP subunit